MFPMHDVYPHKGRVRIDSAFSLFSDFIDYRLQLGNVLFPVRDKFKSFIIQKNEKYFKGRKK